MGGEWKKKRRKWSYGEYIIHQDQNRKVVVEISYPEGTLIKTPLETLKKIRNELSAWTPLEDFMKILEKHGINLSPAGAMMLMQFFAEFFKRELAITQNFVLVKKALSYF